MRFLLQFTAAALLVAIGIGGMATASAADREARAAVMGRQKIREELSVALAKGYLTRMDQYRILLHAKEVLNADDLHGLEQSLDRIATQQAAARQAVIAARKATPAREAAEDETPKMVTPSKYEETRLAEMQVSGEPVPTRAKPSSEPPVIEADPSTIGKPAMHLDGNDPEDLPPDPECEPAEFCGLRHWVDVDCFSCVDGFKGPIDIGNANGNFGLRFGVNAAVPVFRCLGIGLQAGTSVVLSNLKGSPYPEPGAVIRDQLFTTVGMFQRINGKEGGAFTWGFAYDWLFDNYYDSFQFGQWRVKGAWDFNPCDQIGIAAAIPEHGDSGTIPDIFGNLETLSFKPIAQGCLYWRHTWSNDASLTARAGLAERPGEFVFGGESCLPVSKTFALTSEFTYIMPNTAGGAVGQTQEIWNVSFGIEFVPGGFGRGNTARFQPFFPVADNGSMAVRELGP